MEMLIRNGPGAKFSENREPGFKNREPGTGTGFPVQL